MTNLSIIILTVNFSTSFGNRDEAEWSGEGVMSTVLLVRVIPTTHTQLYTLKELHHQKRGLLMQYWRHPDHVFRWG